MARKQRFFAADFSERFKVSYAALAHDRQKGADKVILALMKGEPTPGTRVKPILPDKYYQEARINDGDRLIFRIAEDTVHYVDIVEHDDINRYGRKSG